MRVESTTITSPPATIRPTRVEGCRASLHELGLGERWYVATTLPRKERVAEANLERQQYRVFLPRLLVTRRHANKFKTELAPLFPRYMFVILNIDRQRWRSVNGTLGVERLITDGNIPQVVAPGIVETLIQSSDQRGALVFKSVDLAIGERVRLLTGPFANTLGTLLRLDGAGRVQLLLDLLSKQVKVSVPRDCVALAH
jgi:transcription elongation factor/antiterminator RfaH